MKARITNQNKIMKYTSQLMSGACIAALGFCAPLSLSASPKTSASATASTSPSASATASVSAKPNRFHGMISAVDQSAKTFTIAGKDATRVFKVTDQTKIMKDGNPATMSDIVEKEEVRGRYWKAADGSLEAKTVRLGAKSEKKKEAKNGSPSPSASPSATP